MSEQSVQNTVNDLRMQAGERIASFGEKRCCFRMRQPGPGDPEGGFQQAVQADGSRKRKEQQPSLFPAARHESDYAQQRHCAGQGAVMHDPQQ